MAITFNTQDLQNYPGVNKTVSIDLTNIVPAGYEGDEQIVLVASTSAYANNTDRISIPNFYVTEAKSGWLKSSGLRGGSFPLTASGNSFRIKLDATVSGSDSSGWYTIALDHADGVQRSGDLIAADMEDKIRALANSLAVADVGFTMAYENCSVEFENNRFKIVSGSVSEFYNGLERSSVAVASGITNDCTVMLGFDLYVSSEQIAGIDIREALITTDLPTGSGTFFIQTGTSLVAGDPIAITNGVNTPEYTIVQNVMGDSQVTVSPTFTRNYTAYKAKIQRLRMQDPENQPMSPYDSIDDIARHAIKHITSQIDYSS
jgi:hypothetical protein